MKTVVAAQASEMALLVFPKTLKMPVPGRSGLHTNYHVLCGCLVTHTSFLCYKCPCVSPVERTFRGEKDRHTQTVNENKQYKSRINVCMCTHTPHTPHLHTHTHHTCTHTHTHTHAHTHVPANRLPKAVSTPRPFSLSEKEPSSYKCMYVTYTWRKDVLQTTSASCPYNYPTRTFISENRQTWLVDIHP